MRTPELLNKLVAKGVLPTVEERIKRIRADSAEIDSKPDESLVQETIVKIKPKA